MATYVPGLEKLTVRNTGGTVSARYCYSVWLRHLVTAHENGLPASPEVVAELGPGDSLGIGLAALLSGAEKLYALDLVRYAADERNILIFDELVELFSEREAIPNDDEFPKVKPHLGAYEFPSKVLTGECMNKVLSKDRVAGLRESLARMRSGEEGRISYFAPWGDTDVIRQESVDMVFSQAVLEHVENLEDTYRALNKWLKPGGFMSHQIDFKCHGTAEEWNGHWALGKLRWKLIKGRRRYLINREPLSTHLGLMEKSGFEILCKKRIRNNSSVDRAALAPRFRDITDDDLNTSGAFVLAVKR
ncbi:MAG: methyltransferase domain-containing protein [Nitrospirota bacterium]|jgi:hypothetical protein